MVTKEGCANDLTCLGAPCRCQESIAVMVMIHCLVQTKANAGLQTNVCAAPEREPGSRPVQPQKIIMQNSPGPMKHCAKQMQLRSFRFLPPFSTGRGCLPMNCVAAHGQRDISGQQKTGNRRPGPTMRLWQTAVVVVMMIMMVVALTDDTERHGAHGEQGILHLPPAEVPRRDHRVRVAKHLTAVKQPSRPRLERCRGHVG